VHATTPTISKLLAAPVLVSELPAGTTRYKRYLEGPDEMSIEYWTQAGPFRLGGTVSYQEFRSHALAEAAAKQTFGGLWYSVVGNVEITAEKQRYLVAGLKHLHRVLGR
jgi:hypothetical protein